ncbi:MAG: hypothetical protein QXW10_04180 [Candidatus Micrarchaeaceae archaeon]
MLSKISGIFNGNGSINTDITSISLKWHGESHKAPGLKTRKRIFDIEIPFHNRQDSVDMLKSLLKNSVLDEVEISGISIAAPFKLVNVEPKLPATIKYGESIVFKLAIEAPPYRYKGPLEVSFAEHEPEKVRVEINRIVLVRGPARVNVPHSELVMELRKSQVFKVDIQLYKILSYGDRVGGISTSVPFNFVSSMPAPPFTVDNRNSYIATIFIQAPEINYGGPLEIELK